MHRLVMHGHTRTIAVTCQDHHLAYKTSNTILQRGFAQERGTAGAGPLHARAYAGTLGWTFCFCYLLDVSILPDKDGGQGPCTLALVASQSSVYRELTERVIVIIIIEERHMKNQRRNMSTSVEFCSMIFVARHIACFAANTNRFFVGFGAGRIPLEVLLSFFATQIATRTFFARTCFFVFSSPSSPSFSLGVSVLLC